MITSHSHLGYYLLSGCCCYWASWRDQRPPRWSQLWDWGSHPVMKTHYSLSLVMCWSECPMTSSASLSGKRSSSCSVEPHLPRHPHNPPLRLHHSAAVAASDTGTRIRLAKQQMRSPHRWISSSPSCALLACWRWRCLCPSWQGRTCWPSGCFGWTGLWLEYLLAPFPSSPFWSWVCTTCNKEQCIHIFFNDFCCDVALYK